MQKINLIKDIDSKTIFKINNELKLIEQKIILLYFNYHFEKYNQINFLINKFSIDNLNLLNLLDQTNLYIKYGSVLQVHLHIKENKENKEELKEYSKKYKTAYWIKTMNKRFNRILTSLYSILFQNYIKYGDRNIKLLVYKEMSRYTITDISQFLIKIL